MAAGKILPVNQHVTRRNLQHASLAGYTRTCWLLKTGSEIHTHLYNVTVLHWSCDINAPILQDVNNTGPEALPVSVF